MFDEHVVGKLEVAMLSLIAMGFGGSGCDTVTG